MENTNKITRTNTEPFHLIYCFICGIAFKSAGFITHYNECYESFHNMPLGKERPIREHPSILSILSKLKTGEDITEDLNEYNEIAEELYFNLFSKECPGCNQLFLPEKYLKHFAGCTFRYRSKTLEADNLEDPLKVKDHNKKNEKKQRRKRKSSMDNLKSITKDEVKGFKKFNINAIRQKYKETP